jgi:hypothetical protein
MGFTSSYFVGTEGFRFLSCPTQGLEVNRTLSIVQHSRKRLLLLLDGRWWTMGGGRWKCHHHDWIAHVSNLLLFLDRWMTKLLLEILKLLFIGNHNSRRRTRTVNVIYLTYGRQVDGRTDAPPVRQTQEKTNAGSAVQVRTFNTLATATSSSRSS